MTFRWLIVAFLIALTSACATNPRYDSSSARDHGDVAYAGSIGAKTSSTSAGAEFSAPSHPALTATFQAARQVHYEGSIRLRATQPRRVLEQATEMTRTAGGYVESLTAYEVVLQIPAARFRDLFDQTLGLGEVIKKSMSARDVTEEFSDINLRLQHAKTTRGRLLALIDKATNQKEKLRLLSDVERLTTEIEFLEAQLARLQTLISYSRLKLNVEGRKAFDEKPIRELLGFDWINALRPDIRGTSSDDGKFSLATPTGFVELDEHKSWSAASPDGAAIWTQRRQNNPKGDTKFWLDSIRWRLQDRFAVVEPKTAGEFSVLRCVSREEPRFVYWIGILANDTKLQVIQTYFPSLNHEQRYEAATVASLRGGVK